jgi:hypothetical protein
LWYSTHVRIKIRCCACCAWLAILLVCNFDLLRHSPWGPFLQRRQFCSKLRMFIPTMCSNRKSGLGCSHNAILGAFCASKAWNLTRSRYFVAYLRSYWRGFARFS